MTDPFARFGSLARRLVAVPKDELDAARARDTEERRRADAAQYAALHKRSSELPAKATVESPEHIEERGEVNEGLSDLQIEGIVLSDDDEA